MGEGRAGGRSSLVAWTLASISDVGEERGGTGEQGGGRREEGQRCQLPEENMSILASFIPLHST